MLQRCEHDVGREGLELASDAINVMQVTTALLDSAPSKLSLASTSATGPLAPTAATGSCENDSAADRSHGDMVSLNTQLETKEPPSKETPDIVENAHLARFFAAYVQVSPVQQSQPSTTTNITKGTNIPPVSSTQPQPKHSAEDLRVQNFDQTIELIKSILENTEMLLERSLQILQPSGAATSTEGVAPNFRQELQAAMNMKHLLLRCDIYCIYVSFMWCHVAIFFCANMF